jgi:hypothetical protein
MGRPSLLAAVLLEGWLELAESLKSSVASDTIVHVNNDLFVLSVLVSDGGGVDGDLVLRPSLLLGAGSLLVALDSHLILLLSGDAVLGDNVLGSNSHWHEAEVGLLVLEDLLGEGRWVDHALHWEKRHGLDTASHADLDLSGGNLVGDAHDGLESG